ncbi:NUDIX domain-containing protein [Psychrobacter sp. SZ93C1]|uniref:NUDIX domain-containing protein n=1 Tax=Psychrobacter sp. SZ93C1 TaxID=2792058 RepID=UPI0018CD8912|nr:NUDIX domain-containing protein [Psychrobacter sp. SZ93C1]MBH0064959.1 NUDIX domain-containing protein [Psychrobacter sp. SZ93C1]
MPSKSDKQEITQTIDKKAVIVNVAVAVIHHKEHYLLGFRNATQHQGNRYEFVGGKIDANESAEQALVREVAEETGIAIGNDIVVKLGRLHHDYGDKQVVLQVYKIELAAQQYEQHKHCEYGLEGQALTWVNKSKLLAGEYPLPAANKTILEWLRLPTQITITYSLSHFSECTDPAAAWLQYHQAYLAPESLVYIRTKESDAGRSDNLAAQLMHVRPDVQAIVPYDADSQFMDVDKSILIKDENISHQVVANHLTHTALMQWLESVSDTSVSEHCLSDDFPLIISCHDIVSIEAANKLASARIQQQLPPVIGIFISPVLATHTHPDTVPLGWEAWSALAQLADMPVIGLGGLSPTMIDQALAHGGISVAGIRQFFNSEK